MKFVNRTLAAKHVDGCTPKMVLPGQEGEIDTAFAKDPKNARLMARLAADVKSGELEEVKASTKAEK